MSSDKPPDGWNEYKRLVLAELERLNQAVEKLRDEFVTADKQLTKELADIQASLTKTMTKVIDKGDSDIKKEVNALDDKFTAFKTRFHRDNKISSSWGFWAAIIGMVTSLIVAVISLIVTLSK